MALPNVPATPIVQLYAELHARGVGRQRKLEMARQFVAAPERLAEMYGSSVEAMESFAPRDQPFYTGRKSYAVTGDAVKRTLDLALRLRDLGSCVPDLDPEAGTLEPDAVPAGVRALQCGDLAFEYLDRELVPTRTTGGLEQSDTAVRLDLLLMTRADRTPIVVEVKRQTDKDAFSALVQALACAAHLATPAQYARLDRYGRQGEAAKLKRAVPPTLDLYLVLHDPPDDTWLPQLRVEAQRLSALLLAHPGVARTVRRIACLKTTLDSGQLRVESQYGYERPCQPEAAVEKAFGQYFETSQLRLPAAAVRQHADGDLRARGWSVRWRWRDDAALEIRAAHPMTDERWHVISSDGIVRDKDVTPEMYVVKPDAEERYSAAWRAHTDAVTAADMDFSADTDLPPYDHDREAVWKPRDGLWRRIALAATSQ